MVRTYEYIPGGLKVDGKGCYGCIRHKKDVMISFRDSDNNFHDIFLTDRQNRELILKLLNNVKDRESFLRRIKLNEILK